MQPIVFTVIRFRNVTVDSKFEKFFAALYHTWGDSIIFGIAQAPFNIPGSILCS